MNLQESIRRILREETEPGKYTKAVQVIVDDFKNEDFVCDLDVSYYNEMYEIAVKIDKKEFEKKYESLHLDYANILMKGYLDKLKRTIRQEIKNFLPVDVLVWFKQINCNKGLNESEGKQERKFTKLLNNIEEYINSNSYDSVVRVMVDYDEVMDDVIVNIFFDAEKARELGGGINSMIKRTGKKIMEDLSVFPFDFKYYTHFEKPQLNESEDDEEKKIQKNLTVLRKLISMFEYSEVCDMWVEYNYEDGDYEIKSKMSTKNHNTAALEKEFEFLEDSIKSLGFTNCYVFHPWYVENCEDEVKFMNESENKKSGLLRAIEEDGLYQIMKDTGLSLKQIKSKIGELPRELLERYIKDFLENDEIGWDLSIQISPNKIVDSFYLSDGIVTIEVNEVDSRGRVVAGKFRQTFSFI